MVAAETLAHIISENVKRFGTITEEEWSLKPMPGKWSKKEILGHLVDSAQNNLRRFVVTQYRQNDTIMYWQDEWVTCQDYQNLHAQHIIDLWKLLNLQICHTINNIPAEKLQYTCNTGKETPQLHTLEFLIEDYIVHLKHHLVAIVEQENNLS